LPLSVLDLSPVGVGIAPSQAVRDSVTLAEHAERLGYHRYWVAEHHNMASIAASAPEVMITRIAAATRRIRVGAGGIMLPNHTPLRVVEIFRTLEALFPGRIDLGLGRAPGTDPITSIALRRGDDDVNQLLAEVIAFERGELPEKHPFRAITPMPSDVRIGAMWMLGSTLAGASIAAALGLRYAFAGHFAMRHAREAIAHYRREFQPSAGLAAPYAMLAVTAVCGEDDEHAARLSAPLRVAIVNTRTGRPAPIPSVEDAVARRFTGEEQAIVDEFLRGAVIAGPARAARELAALATDLGADELMLSTLLPDLDARRASLERIATAFAGTVSHG
jgi:luciferase family oxidoreductase group 1